MKLIQMDVSQALGFLGLTIKKSNGVTHILKSSDVEATLEDAEQEIRESENWLALAAESPLAGGAQYAHIKNISAWTVLKPYLKSKEV